MPITENEERITELEGKVSRQAARIEALSTRATILTDIVKDAGLGTLLPLSFRVTPDGENLAQKVAALMDHLGVEYVHEPQRWVLRQKEDKPCSSS